MNSTDPNTEQFPVSFSSDNTLIVSVGEDPFQTAGKALSSIETDGCTVVITDSFLFQNKVDTTFQQSLEQLLLRLKAKKIIFTSYRGYPNQQLCADVKRVLSQHNCIVDFKSAQIHDRYWISIENKAGLVMNSITGIGKKTSTIKRLDSDEIEALISDFVTQAVLPNNDEK